MTDETVTTAKRHGMIWGPREIEDLKESFERGVALAEIMRIHERARTGIESRLTMLGAVLMTTPLNFWAGFARTGPMWPVPVKKTVATLFWGRKPPNPSKPKKPPEAPNRLLLICPP